MEIENVEALPRKYWMSNEKPVKSESKSRKQVTSNIVALIVSCATETFPELQDCKEERFMRFQEQMQKIISKEIEK